MAPQLHRVGRIGSTMDHLHQLAEAQTGGRGSRGRAWHSPPGGLWLSVLYRPASPAGAELLSLRLGLRAAEALETTAPGLSVMLKWPNDLIVGDRKLGGILCEARWQGGSLAWIAAGVGLNVTNPIPDELRLSATALGKHLPGATVDAILPGLLDALRRPLADADRLTADEGGRLERRDWLRGRELRAPLAGRAEGIASDGALMIRTDHGTRAVRTGHVELADGSSPR